MNNVSNDLPVPQWSDTARREGVLAACALLEPIFRRHLDERHLPGVTYGVVVEGELIFTQSFGVRNVATGAPVDADTVFRIASMTKSFAALAILQLRDAGKLRLDEPVATYVPELAALPYPTSDSPLITVRHLLTMAAGWPQDDPWGDRQLYREDAAMSDFYRAGVSWSNPPGVTYEYSNYAYMVLGRIITNVAGKPAIQTINEQILKPLGMSATVWNAGDVPGEHLAQGYRWEDEMWKEEPLLPSGGDVAAFAGLFTSVRDLARWVALFQSAWPPRSEAENGPLHRSSLREMQRVWSVYEPVVTTPTLGARPEIVTGGYGFGLSVRHNGVWASVGHGGGLPGFGSHMRWAPDYGIGIVALGNLTYARVSDACTKGLELLVTKSQVQPYQRLVALALAAARDDILRLLQSWDRDLAERLFADNFFLDRDLAHWRRELAQLDERHGQLMPTGPFVVENWLRGEWRMRGERGWCTMSITLSPTVPPRIQSWDIESTLPATPALQHAAEQVALCIAKPTWRALRAICANNVELTPLWDQVRLANILCGHGPLGEAASGDGATWANFPFQGSKGNATLQIKVDTQGKVTDLCFQPTNNKAQ